MEDMETKNRDLEKKISEERLKNAIEKTKMEGSIEKIRLETDGMKSNKRAFAELIMKQVEQTILKNCNTIAN